MKKHRNDAEIRVGEVLVGKLVDYDGNLLLLVDLTCREGLQVTFRGSQPSTLVDIEDGRLVLLDHDVMVRVLHDAVVTT